MPLPGLETGTFMPMAYRRRPFGHPAGTTAPSQLYRYHIFLPGNNITRKYNLGTIYILYKQKRNK